MLWNAISCSRAIINHWLMDDGGTLSNGGGKIMTKQNDQKTDKWTRKMETE